MRWLLRKAPAPPTFDLFADATNALTLQVSSPLHPFTPTTLLTSETCFFQPPYKDLTTHWLSCMTHIHTTTGFWGLVPHSFFKQEVLPHFPTRHCCFKKFQVNYKHPTLPGDRASFKSVVFFLPATTPTPTSEPVPPTHKCHCHYLTTYQPLTAHKHKHKH